ncbi:MAG: polysaccharide deacetylase family protein [Eubacteriales bacterium]|nr:polysaccharide deacetylase family protein [Eubacteriales bacterium]
MNMFFRRHKRIIAVGGVTVFFLLILTIHFIVRRHLQKPNESLNLSSPLQYFFKESEKPFDPKLRLTGAGQEFHLVYEGAAAVADLHYPQTGEKSFDRLISLYVQNYYRNFRYRYSQTGLRSPEDKSGLRIRYALSKLANRIYSVLIVIEEYDALSDENPRVRYQSFLYDDYYKRHISNEELISADGYTAIAEAVSHEMSQKLGNSGVHLEADPHVLKSLLFKPYAIAAYIDPSLLPAGGNEANPVILSYRSLDEGLYFKLSEDERFHYDPPIDPRESTARPVFTSTADPFDAKPADPNGKIKYVALSFNFAPTPEVTDKTLELLREYNSTATFFVSGSVNGDQAEGMQAILAQGSELGNLAMDGRSLIELGSNHMQEAFANCDRLIEAATGTRPVLTRSLYGVYDDRLLQSTIGRPLALYDIDAGDWSDNTNTSEVKSNVFSKSLKAGSIILMQNQDAFSNLALKDILPSLINEGYRVVSISELYRIYHGRLDTDIPHRNAVDDDPDLAHQLEIEARIASGMTPQEAAVEETMPPTETVINMG